MRQWNDVYQAGMRYKEGEGRSKRRKQILPLRDTQGQDDKLWQAIT